jgi:hypothetical protein
MFGISPKLFVLKKGDLKTQNIIFWRAFCFWRFIIITNTDKTAQIRNKELFREDGLRVKGVIIIGTKHKAKNKVFKLQNAS